MILRTFVWVAVGAMIAVLGYWGVSSGARDSNGEVGIPPETVADYLHAVIRADRAVYTTHIVERMQIKGIVVASENWEQRNTLPLPAQFMKEAARLVMEYRVGVRYRLSSLWPINEQNGPVTDSERKGLGEVLINPDRPYTGIVTSSRGRYFQAVYADRAISQTCVGCHNTHPNSPKRDFRPNDVMGAIVITIPLGS